MKKTLTRSGLDSNMLKLIAIAAMTADHIAWLLFPGYPTDPLPIILHIIGRLTCPIMCFFMPRAITIRAILRNIRRACLCLR